MPSSTRTKPSSTNHSSSNKNSSIRPSPPPSSSPSHVKAQAYIRGYLARKQYKKLVKKQQHRAKVVKEIYATEVSYVKSMEILIQVYLEPLKADPRKYGLSKEDMHHLFFNVETIANFHKEILKALQERVQAWSNVQRIGDIFVRYAPYLKMLNGYCSNYDVAVTTFNQARQEKKQFAAFIEKCEAQDSVQSIPSHLIQPIQRVPRYNLLLEELIRSTWEWHNDYETLCNALRAMKLIADHINESLHKNEKANKVVKIQSDLGGECSLVEPHRRWIKDGPVTRVKRQGLTSSPVSTSKLWIYLFNDVIVFAGRILLSYRFIEKYPLHSTSITDLPGTDKFHIVCDTTHSAYILAAESEEAKNEWIQAINTAIQHYSVTVTDIKAEQRKTIDRETSFPLLPPTSTPNATTPNHSLTPAHSSMLASPQFQQQLASRLQRQASPYTHSTTLATPTNPTPHRTPTPSLAAPISPPTHPIAQHTRPQQRPPSDKTHPNPQIMKLDFPNIITEEDNSDEEEEEMTFAERRLMFERGLLPQAQVTAPTPRRPAAKVATKTNVNNVSNKVVTTLRAGLVRELLEINEKKVHQMATRKDIESITLQSPHSSPHSSIVLHRSSTSTDLSSTSTARSSISTARSSTSTSRSSTSSQPSTRSSTLAVQSLAPLTTSPSPSSPTPPLPTSSLPTTLVTSSHTSSVRISTPLDSTPLPLISPDHYISQELELTSASQTNVPEKRADKKQVPAAEHSPPASPRYSADTTKYSNEINAPLLGKDPKKTETTEKKKESCCVIL